MMKKLQMMDVVWLVAAALAILVMSFPMITAIGMMALFLPGLILSVLPTVVLYATPGYLVFRISRLMLGDPGRWRTVASASIGLTVSLAALLIGTKLVEPHNLRVHSQAAALTAGDVGTSGPIHLSSVVAVRIVSADGIVDPRCGDICQRLLLLRAVDKVIVGPLESSNAPQVHYYQMSSVNCPKSPQENKMIPRVLGNSGPNLDTFKIVRDEADKGNCIVHSSGPSDDQVITISYSTIKRGKTQFDDPWSLSPDLLGAARLELTDREGKILFRQTEVKFYEIQPYISAAAGFLTSVTYTGWGRSEILKNRLGQLGTNVLSKVLDTEAFGTARGAR